MSRLRLATVLVVLLSACDSGRRYIGVGDVINADASGVTIRHDAIAGLMDAGTTAFAAASADLAQIPPGTRVRFELRRRGDELQITRASELSRGNPGLHDHTPHHGGVVAMAGMIHLEAKAFPDGRLQLYLTDIWRRPLPLDDVSGTVTLDLPQGKRTLPLAVVGAALEAQGPAVTQPAINAGYALRRADQPVEVSFLLPLAQGDSGAAGIPADGCVAAASAPGAPRCTMQFGKPVVAVTLSPDADTLLVAQVDFGVSAWRLPTGQFRRGFAQPPPVPIPVDEPAHPEAPNAVSMRPGGREAVVALENRLIRYSLDSGEVVRALNGPGGIVRAVAWSPDGGDLLVSTFYNAAVFLVRAADGSVARRLAVEREGAAVAFSPDGRMLAAASEAGPITLFSATADQPLHLLRGARGPARTVAFVHDRVIAAGEDGVLRAWNPQSGALVLERPLGGIVRAMAVNRERGQAALVGNEPQIRVVDLADGAVLDTLSWHGAQVLGLAWVGTTLVSGDAAGRVALWERP